MKKAEIASSLRSSQWTPGREMLKQVQHDEIVRIVKVR